MKQNGLIFALGSAGFQNFSAQQSYQTKSCKIGFKSMLF